ncbi:hypothetical protein Q7C36_000325 [Tachysurus vachellii]|uniref:Uncharacterized protein n=1 Tax=Tachysurus vachellii TaxID=175792 RepID=A0AA88P0Z2_TACVA|nr:hypothetical protein Q7C36_000325 [Tachysurus vachellii]
MKSERKSKDRDCNRKRNNRDDIKERRKRRRSSLGLSMSSASSASEQGDNKEGQVVLTAKEEWKKQKEMMKALETPEEKKGH